MSDETPTNNKPNLGERIPRVAMSIHAHPDDQEFTVAGTLARWAAGGCRVISVIITSGEAGTNDPEKDEAYAPELAALREAEQLAANAVLGVSETVFLHYPDGTLTHTLALRRDLARQIRKHKPDTVVCGDPTVRFYSPGYLNHPDHRAAADAAIDAVFPSAGSRPIFPELLREGFEPHDVSYLFIHGSEKPDTWVDIHSSIERKVAALRCHKSQIGEWDVDKEMRDWAAADGKDHGLAYAESYRVMVLREDSSAHEEAAIS